MNTPTRTNVNPCFASTPAAGIVHRCTLPMHFSGDHDSGLHQWPDMPDAPVESQSMSKADRAAFARLMTRGLATDDVLVAPPSARNVTPA